MCRLWPVVRLSSMYVVNVDPLARLQSVEGFKNLWRSGDHGGGGVVGDVEGNLGKPRRWRFPVGQPESYCSLVTTPVSSPSTLRIRPLQKPEILDLARAI